MNTFVIEARVRENNNAVVIKYLGRTNQLNPINPEWALKNLRHFSTKVNEATFFVNHQEATNAFNDLINDLIEPNTEGKTLFVPPASDLIGGVHGRRTVTIILRLVTIVGDGLSESKINTLYSTQLTAEEYDAGPYSIRQNTRLNLELVDNKLGGYDLTVPALNLGDVYRSTRIDHLKARVLHECWDEQGRPVLYTCTAMGNILQREVMV